MDYITIPDFDKDSLSKLNSVDNEVVMLTILSIVTKSDNYDLAIKVTRQFVDDNNEFIRGVAVECISHIARLWTKLPADLIEKINKIMSNDTSAWVRDKVQLVFDDLEIFIKDYKRPSK